MATFDDVARVVAALPGSSEGERHGTRAWSVGRRVFAWERPFSKADIRRFGSESPPAGPILAVSVEDLSEKEAALAAHPEAVFTIPHFDGFAAVLVQLDVVTDDVLEEVLLDAWLTAAPADVARPHLEALGYDQDDDSPA